MATLAKYKIDLELTTAKFNRQLKTAGGGLKTLGKQALAIGKVMGAVLPAAGLAGLAAMTKQALENQAALHEMSQRLGVSTEGLSRLQYAAEQSGVGVSTLNMGLQRMTRRVSEAAAGTGEAKKALAELGISAQKLTKLRPEEQFKVLADSIMGVEDPADRVRLAMKLFDSEGVSLIQTMQGGSKAIEAMGAEADRLGVTVGTKAAESAKRATDAFGRLSASFTGVANTIGSQFAPEIEGAANWMSDAFPKAIEFARKALIQARQGFVQMVKGVVDARIAWNEFTGDLEEAEGLRKTSKILEQMVGDLVEERMALESASGATREYTVDTDKARYSLEQFTSTAVVSSKTLDTELQSVINSLKTQEEKILESFQRRREIIQTNTEAESALRMDLMARLNDQTLQEVEVQAQMINKTFEDVAKTTPISALAGEFEQSLGQMSNATRDFAGEQSGIYKALFAVEKAAAIARAIVSIQTGIAQAAANPWPANLAAMASVAAATAGIVSTITSTQFGGGRAMGGNVDGGKSYMVGERGPELFMPQGSGTVVPNNQISQAPQVNIRNVNAFDTAVIGDYMGSGSGERVIMNVVRRNQRAIKSLAAN